jgi:hypothetical protein
MPGYRGRRRSRLGLRWNAFRSLFLVRYGALRSPRILAFQIRRIEAVEPPQLDRHVLVDGAGVRFLFGDAQFGESIQNLVGLYFQLPRQLVDANLLHR